MLEIPLQDKIVEFNYNIINYKSYRLDPGTS